MVELLVISILCILAIVIAILIRYAICHDLKKSVQDVMRFVNFSKKFGRSFLEVLTITFAIQYDLGQMNLELSEQIM